MIAEIWRAVKADPAAVALQWGRDHVIAEILVAVDNTAHLAMLQWGRDHVIAEIKLLIRGDVRLYFASMGPRSRDRGNPREYGSDHLRLDARFNGAAIT